MKIKSTALPPIGMRIIKSSIGVLLGFIIYLIRGRRGAPFYTALSVLWCMQPYPSNARANARQRTIGTMIGVYSLIINYFRIGLLSVFNLVICIYISYLVKVIINALIDILDRNK